MFSFAQFLLEAKAGDITASQGHANEFFTNDHGNIYAQAAHEALARGASDDEAHNAGIAALRSTKYSHNKYAAGKTTQKAVGILGKDASKIVHDNSKNTAEAMAQYIHQKFGGHLAKSLWVGAGQAKAAEQATGGKKTNGDLLLMTEHRGQIKNSEAHLENEPFTGFGGSLKYSSSDKDSQTKIHSPGINTLADIIDDHHQQMFGKSSDIHNELEKAVREGQAEQRKVAVAVNSRGMSHHDVLSHYIDQLRQDPERYRPKGVKPETWAKLIKNSKYTPSINQKTGAVEGADVNEHFLSLIRKTVRDRTSGLDHASLDEYYKDLSNANSNMKNKMADALYAPISRILSAKGSTPEEQNRINTIKESLHRSVANVHSPDSNANQLPTLLVKTAGDGTVSISDSNESFKNHLKDENNLSFSKKSPNKGTFRVGPGTITVDARPGTMHNPLINPANYTVPSTFFKADTVKYKDGNFDRQIEGPTPSVVSTKPIPQKSPIQQPARDNGSATPHPFGGTSGKIAGHEWRDPDD